MQRNRVMQLWRLARLLFGVLLLAFAAPVAAGEAEDRTALDRLFAVLRVAPDAATAQQIGQQIWDVWTQPSDPELAQRMSEALVARGAGDIDDAILLLDKLTEDYPDYAEGWNQRATMFYLIGDFERSIADCDKVLALEPRHFGALSGRALMYLQMGKRELALKDMAAAVTVHPYLSERRLFPELGEPMTHI